MNKLEYICDEKKKMRMALIPQLVITLLTIPLVIASLYGPKDQVFNISWHKHTKSKEKECHFQWGWFLPLPLPLSRW